jgi:hypothetical protein
VVPVVVEGADVGGLQVVKSTEEVLVPVNIIDEKPKEEHNVEEVRDDFACSLFEDTFLSLFDLGV